MELRTVDPRKLKANPNNPRRSGAGDRSGRREGGRGHRPSVPNQVHVSTAPPDSGM